MRVTKIQVNKLFGTFDHTIPLRLNDRITIIHGPNGFGKTALLQLVRSLLKAKFSKLRKIPFQRFALSFEDGREIAVTKLKIKEEQNLDGSRDQLHFVQTKNVNLLESHLRVSFHLALFTTTELYQNVLSWANSHQASKIKS